MQKWAGVLSRLFKLASKRQCDPADIWTVFPQVGHYFCREHLRSRPLLDIRPLGSWCGAERRSGLFPWTACNVHFGLMSARQGELQLALAMVQLCRLRLYALMAKKQIIEVKIPNECG
ncbi:hypothetical protein M2324_003829 [Rhodovulum sulfidophilum]|uniref:hypothetical protein n=1 Tax=Rhodovulum sulfidophilum TaxID=35806 RepID=UPI001E6090EB|nr:hypothetical protein [Rhodovulum sulfidophilum]MCW2305405.1 hypothetical protein [Rhodovulum sulfidophilum]